MSDTTSLPDGWGDKPPEWHYQRFVEFTRYKQEIGEPSPHLAVVVDICETEDLDLNERLWLIGNYGCSYCLPTAQVTQAIWKYDQVVKNPDEFDKWLKDNWPGIVTRTERRVVRTYPKYSRCLREWVVWIQKEFPKLLAMNEPDDRLYYEKVYQSVTSVFSIGRYIAIRMIEGMRRCCGLNQAKLYDIRSIGGWSPKKCLTYLYPQFAKIILIDDKEGNKLTDQLASDLLSRVQEELPWVDYYIVAAMMCEYKGAYEKRHQYVGWTIDQEPLLYEKVLKHFGDKVSGISEILWNARKRLHPEEVLGEIQKWGGTRWEVAKLLRDFGYVWSDLRYDYWATARQNCWATPVARKDIIRSEKRGLYAVQRDSVNQGIIIKGEASVEKGTQIEPAKKTMNILEIMRSRRATVGNKTNSPKSPAIKPTPVLYTPSAIVQGEHTRKSINEIIPGKLYQRGQIFTWKRKEKESLIEKYNIGLVVNFWPKIDYDMGELPCMYWHTPVPEADGMVSGRIIQLADAAANMMEKESIVTLSLCEAGKTRSIFFAILIMSKLLGCSKREAYEIFIKKGINSKLRPSMTQYLTKEQP